MYLDRGFRAILVSVVTITGSAIPLNGQQDTTAAPTDTTVIPLEELRVEISRLRTGGVPLARTPLSAQVVRQAELRQVGHTTVADALGRLSGVTLVDQAGSPFQPDVRLRGFAVSPIVGVPQSVSVFVDGVRVNEADASQVHFNLIPMEEVERVEVIRGPLGPFGKNTLAGALNVVTRRGDGRPSAALELNGGYYEELEARGRADGRLGGLDFYGAGKYYRSDGWRQKNAAEQLQSFLKLGWRDRDTDLWVSYSFARDSIEGPQALPRSWLEGAPLPPEIRNAPDDRRQLQFTQGNGDYFLPHMHFVNSNIDRRLGENWSLQGNAFGRFVDFEQFNDGIAEPNALGLTDIASAGVAVQLSHRRGRELIATLGAEYVRNDVDIEILELPNPSFPEIDPAGEQTERVGTEEDNFGVYSELWWALGPRVSVYGSLRFDHVSIPFRDLLDPSQSGDNDFDQVTGAVGADVGLREDLWAFASYGRGFRAPVILELSCADPEDPCPLPFELGADPPLDPVKTDTWQLGLRYLAGTRLSAEVTGHWSEVHDDLFNVLDPERPTRGFFRNLDRTRRQGVELTAISSPARDLGVTATFAWTRATFQSAATLAPPFFEGDEEEEEEPADMDGDEQPPVTEVEPGDRFPIVPEFTFGLDLEYTPSDWAFRVSGRFVGSQFLIGDEANTERFGKLDSYFLLDGYVERTLGPVTLYLRGLNLLDLEHETFGVVSANPRAENEEVEPFFTPGYPFRLFGGVRYRIR